MCILYHWSIVCQKVLVRGRSGGSVNNTRHDGNSRSSSNNGVALGSHAAVIWIQGMKKLPRKRYPKRRKGALVYVSYRL